MMREVEIHLKRLGKKKIYSQQYYIEKKPKTLQELIEACVVSEIKRYKKAQDIDFISFLSPAEIQAQSENGKISFGNDTKPNLQNKNEPLKFESAIQIALEAYKDGLFVVFVDDQEVTSLTQQLQLSPSTQISFIKMTFLTGISF